MPARAEAVKAGRHSAIEAHSDVSRPRDPAADIFPMVPDDGLASLAESIKANGLRFPIVVRDVPNEDGEIEQQSRASIRCSRCLKAITRRCAPILLT